MTWGLEVKRHINNPYKVNWIMYISIGVISAMIK